MVRKSLIAVALLSVAAPAAAQEDWSWTSSRPDGHAPVGVVGDRLLSLGSVEFGYRFSNLNSQGVWFGTDSLTLDETLEFYDVAPLALTNQTHSFTVSMGATESLTFIASMDYSSRSREQLSNSGVFYVTEADELGDLSLTGLYSIYDEGAYRAHVQLGALVPTGSDDVRRETPFSSPDVEGLPYDMRPGGGTFAVLPGISAQVQNEVGTVGAQVRGTLPVGTNDRDYSLGNQVYATGWAAYKLNEYFSISARFQYQKWSGINGQDPDLDPIQDPGNDAFFLEGERLDLPVGINLYMPEGSSLEGHRLSLEAIFPTHHEYQGPQLALDWGLMLGWQVVF